MDCDDYSESKQIRHCRIFYTAFPIIIFSFIRPVFYFAILPARVKSPTNPVYTRIRGVFDCYSPSIGTIRFGLKNSSTSWIPRIS